MKSATATLVDKDGSGLLRLDEPPPQHARLSLPPALGKRFMLLADAEEEFDWTQPFRRNAVDTETIASLPEATQRFNAHGVTPTYLVDWPVVSNIDSAATIAALSRDDLCDVGTQLHPWVNPPFSEDVSTYNSYTGNLPVTLQREKLIKLTAKIADVVGYQPQIYRAGRYGIGPETAAMLVESGYRIDASSRAGFDYRDQYGPDFSRHPIWPWAVGSGLYEVPLTTAYTGIFRHRQRLPRFGRSHGVLARLGIIDRVPLTPEGVRLKDALVAIRQLLDDGHELFSLSFHTPSIVPGHTPYVRDAADLRRFWAWWDGVFNLFAQHNVLAVRPPELIAAFDAQ